LGIVTPIPAFPLRGGRDFLCFVGGGSHPHPSLPPSRGKGSWVGLLVGGGAPHPGLPPSRGKGQFGSCWPVGLVVGGDGFGYLVGGVVDELAGLGVLFEGAVEFQFLGHFADGGDDLLAHEAEAAHLVIVGHGAVAIPEEDAAGAQVLEDVANLGYDRLGGAGDDAVVGGLVLVRTAVGAEASGGAEGGGGQAAGSAGSMSRQTHDSGVDLSLVAGQEGVADAGQVLASNFLGLLLGLVHVNLPQVGHVLGPGVVAELGGGLMVKLEGLLGGFQLGGQEDQGIGLLGGPLHRLNADGGGNPDGRMGLLQGPHPGIDVAIVVVLALPAPGAGGGPGLDKEVVGLLEPLAVEVGRRVMGITLASATSDKAGHQASVGDHVDHGKLLGKPQGVVPDGEDIAQDDYLGLVGDAGQDGSADVGDALHTEGSAVVLVEHEGIEAHFLGVHLLVQVTVVEAGANVGVVVLVADAQVGGLGAHQARVVILPGLLGKVAD